MKKLILFLVVLFLTTETFSQTLSDSTSIENKVNDSLPLKPRIYKTNIVTFNEKGYTKGYLSNLSDSGLYLSSSPVQLSLEKKNNSHQAYNYDQLKRVIIQRKGAVGRSAGYGALIGLGVGVITGLATTANDDNPGFIIFPRGTVVTFMGILGLGAGGLIGAVTGGLAHKTFIINGNKKKYKEMRESILNK